MKIKKKSLILIIVLVICFINTINVYSEEKPEFYIRVVGFGISAHLWGFTHNFLHIRKIDSSGTFVFNPGGAIDLGWYPKKDNWYVNFTFSGFNDCWGHSFYVATLGGGYDFIYKSFIAGIGLAIGIFSVKQMEYIEEDNTNYHIKFYPRSINFFAAINSNIGFKFKNNMMLALNVSFTYQIMFFGLSYTIFIY